MKLSEIKDLLKTNVTSDKKRLNPIIIWITIGAILFISISNIFTINSTDKEEKSNSISENNNSSDEYIEILEERLTETLKKINGAGEVSVLIYIDSGEEKILATDKIENSTQKSSSDSTDEKNLESEKKVVLSGQNSNQAPYIIKENKPIPTGVLVVAEGAKNEKIKKEMYEAVKALFGLPPHRIKIAEANNTKES